jgi:hypothetical protein
MAKINWKNSSGGERIELEHQPSSRRGSNPIDETSGTIGTADGTAICDLMLVSRSAKVP